MAGYYEWLIVSSFEFTPPLDFNKNPLIPKETVVRVVDVSKRVGIKDDAIAIFWAYEGSFPGYSYDLSGVKVNDGKWYMRTQRYPR